MRHCALASVLLLAILLGFVFGNEIRVHLNDTLPEGSYVSYTLNVTEDYRETVFNFTGLCTPNYCDFMLLKQNDFFEALKEKDLSLMATLSIKRDINTTLFKEQSYHFEEEGTYVFATFNSYRNDTNITFAVSSRKSSAWAFFYFMKGFWFLFMLLGMFFILGAVGVSMIVNYKKGRLFWNGLTSFNKLDIKSTRALLTDLDMDNEEEDVKPSEEDLVNH
ncbi:hypothetical protein ABK040_005782 [Willaertia magna]